MHIHIKCEIIVVEILFMLQYLLKLTFQFWLTLGASIDIITKKTIITIRYQPPSYEYNTDAIQGDL